jgi:hypothetical protein
MSSAIRLFPLYALMAWTRAALPFIIIIIILYVITFIQVFTVAQLKKSVSRMFNVTAVV